MSAPDVLPHLAHFAEIALHLLLAATYGFASWAIRRFGHPPLQVYLTACVLYAVLGVVLGLVPA